MKKLIRILFAIVVVSVILWIAIINDTESPPAWILAIYNFPLGDKIGHFLLSGLLAYAIAGAVPKRYRLTALILLGVLLAVEETSQLFLPRRTFSLFDLGAGLLGLVAFGWVGMRSAEE